MDIGQVMVSKKGASKAKVRIANTREKGRGTRGGGEAKGSAPTDESHFAGECGFGGNWEAQEGTVQESESAHAPGL